MILSHKDLLYQIEIDGTTVTIYKNNDIKTYTTIERIGELQPQHFCVLNYIKVDEGQSDNFESRFLGRAAHLNDTQGFVALRALRPFNLDHHYVIITLWDSREHFEEWQQSGQHLNFHHQWDGMLDSDVIDIKWSYNIKFDMA